MWPALELYESRPLGGGKESCPPMAGPPLAGKTVRPAKVSRVPGLDQGPHPPLWCGANTNALAVYSLQPLPKMGTLPESTAFETDTVWQTINQLITARH